VYEEPPWWAVGPLKAVSMDLTYDEAHAALLGLVGIPLALAWTAGLTTEVAGLAISMASAVGASEIYVDVIGLGAGPVDQLREHKEHEGAPWEVYDVNVAETAPDPDHGEEAARSLRDWLWIQGRDWIHDEAPSFAGLEHDTAQDLAGELATPAYSTDSSGRLVVESKDKLRGRGITSPDMADSLLLTFAPKPTPIFVG